MTSEYKRFLAGMTTQQIERMITARERAIESARTSGRGEHIVKDLESQIEAIKDFRDHTNSLDVLCTSGEGYCLAADQCPKELRSGVRRQPNDNKSVEEMIAQCNAVRNRARFVTDSRNHEI